MTGGLSVNSFNFYLPMQLDDHTIVSETFRLKIAVSISDLKLTFLISQLSGIQVKADRRIDIPSDWST